MSMQSLKGKRGQWTKWGGARKAVFQERINETWTCQSCSKLQPNVLKPFKFQYPEHEYIRVCAICLFDGCIALKAKIISIEFMVN